METQYRDPEGMKGDQRRGIAVFGLVILACLVAAFLMLEGMARFVPVGVAVPCSVAFASLCRSTG